jgi:hypothetical protein
VLGKMPNEKSNKRLVIRGFQKRVMKEAGRRCWLGRDEWKVA